MLYNSWHNKWENSLKDKFKKNKKQISQKIHIDLKVLNQDQIHCKKAKKKQLKDLEIQIHKNICIIIKIVNKIIIKKTR